PSNEYASHSKGLTTSSKACADGQDGADKDKGKGIIDVKKEYPWVLYCTKETNKKSWICKTYNGFKSSEREWLGLDGAFISGPFPGQVLTDVGIDANNGIYLVAYGIIEVECKDSWCFEAAMKELKNTSVGAHVWLSKISPKHWAKSYFSKRAHSDVLINNLCDVFNGKIVQGRDKPIITTLEFIGEYCMKRMVPRKKRIRREMKDRVVKNGRLVRRAGSSSVYSKQKKNKGKVVEEPSSKSKKVVESSRGSGGGFVGASGGEKQPKRVRFSFDEPTQRLEVTSEVASLNGASVAIVQTCPSSAGQSVQGGEFGGPSQNLGWCNS
ncbi:hypothetical protein Tco_0942924, partial [Tanacetum coccineum]